MFLLAIAYSTKNARFTKCTKGGMYMMYDGINLPSSLLQTMPKMHKRRKAGEVRHNKPTRVHPSGPLRFHWTSLVYHWKLGTSRRRPGGSPAACQTADSCCYWSVELWQDFEWRFCLKARDRRRVSGGPDWYRCRYLSGVDCWPCSILGVGWSRKWYMPVK